MKQTAVEWLEEQLNKIFISNEIQQTKHLFEQAKEMEKQQIINAHGVKTKRGERQGISFWESKNGEQYYNETYKPSA